MRTPPLPRLALILCATLAAGACQAEPIRLYELREAPAGSPNRAAYDRLETAIFLVNDFLASPAPDAGRPLGHGRFLLDHTDVLMDLGEDGIWTVRLATAGWGDPRTLFGDGVHPNATGFTSERSLAADAAGESARDDGFLALAPPDMAATLLRQAVMMREIRTRGAFDYWLNYDVLGLDPGAGWREDNPVTADAHALEQAFRAWLAARG